MTTAESDTPRKTITFANMSEGRGYDADRLAQVTVPDREWAWGGSRGEGTRTCIIDSGLRPDFNPLVVDAWMTVLRDEEGEWAVGQDETPSDAANHGSDCAYIINAIAPETRLTSVRVLGDGLGGSSRALLAAMEWATAQGFDVINLSLSTANVVAKHALHEVIDQAAFNGIAVVAAANNRAIRSFPWGFSAVFSCGSHSLNDPEWIEVNPTPPAEYFARGVRVGVPRPNGARSLVSGNSFAAPHLAGLIARIRGKHPRITPLEIHHVLSVISNNVAPRLKGATS